MTTPAANVASLILRRAAAVHHEPLAKSIGADVTFISKFLSGDRGLRLDHLGPFLERLGLKLVVIDDGDVSMSKGEVESITRLAIEALNARLNSLNKVDG